MAQVAKERRSNEQKMIDDMLKVEIDDQGTTLGEMLCVIAQVKFKKTGNWEEVRVRVRTEGRPGSPGSRSTPIPARAPSGPAMVLDTHQPSPRGARSPLRRCAGSSRPSPRPPRHTQSLGVAASGRAPTSVGRTPPGPSSVIASRRAEPFAALRWLVAAVASAASAHTVPWGGRVGPRVGHAAFESSYETLAPSADHARQDQRVLSNLYRY